MSKHINNSCLYNPPNPWRVSLWQLGKDLWDCQIHIDLFAAGSKGEWTTSPGLGGVVYHVKELWGERNFSAPSSQVPHEATKQKSHWGQSQQSKGHGDQLQLGVSQHTAQVYWIMMSLPIRMAQGCCGEIFTSLTDGSSHMSDKLASGQWSVIGLVMPQSLWYCRGCCQKQSQTQ